MGYQIITTKRFQRSLNSFLRRISQIDKKHLQQFQDLFNHDPFDPELYTHPIHKDEGRNVIIYSSSITYKVRLIWLLKGNTIILLYQIMTDHDYHKILQLKQQIIKLSDDL